MAAYDNFGFKTDKEKYDLDALEARIAALENSSGTGGAKTVFPVGYIFITTNSNTDPNRVFPETTWERFGAGRMLVGYNASDGDFNSVNKTGGNKIHNHTIGSTKLTESQIPYHRHGVGAHQHHVYWQYTSDTGLDPDQYNTIKNDARIFSEFHEGSTAWRLTLRPDKNGHTFGNLNATAVANASSPLTTGGAVNNQNTDGAGGGGEHSHSIAAASSMPPYIVCYMWRRTA